MLDRTTLMPPANVDAEQALLGAILIDNSVIDRIAGTIEPDDFSESLHAHMFATMRTERADGKLVSPLTLKPFMATWPDVADGLPVSKYLAKLSVNAPTTMNALAYAETVKDHASRRKLFSIGEHLTRISANPEAAVKLIASETVTALDEVLSVTGGKRTGITFEDAVSEALDRILNDDSSTVIQTGVRDLDKLLSGGWRRQQYIIVAGRPGMGKTTFATSAMLRTAKAGHGVMMLSMEMPQRSIMDRALTDLAFTSARRIQYKHLNSRMSDGDLKMISDAASAYRKLPIYIDDQGSMTVAEIGSRIRAQKQRFEREGVKLGLVVLDHLGYIRASERYRGNRVHEVTEISAGLGRIAKDQDIALMVLSQLNRGTEARENKRPSQSDLRDSGSLEQDADVIIFTYREAYYLERIKYDAGSQQELQRQTDLDACRNTMELIVAKSRQTEPGIITCFCDMGSNAVRDLA